MVALGARTAGVMGSEDLRDAVVAAGRRSGEGMWPMPLPAELRRGFDSTVADFGNSSADRLGGMLVAGLFLAEFVPDGLPWAHIDIAGPELQHELGLGLHAQGRHRRPRAHPPRGHRGPDRLTGWPGSASGPAVELARASGAWLLDQSRMRWG